jgi:hypothetical protein
MNKTYLVTVMLPSRGRPISLLNTVDSVNASARGKDYEILVRLDNDDEMSLAIIPLLEEKGCKVFVGERLGYAKLDTGYYTELANASNSHWVWILGDDAQVDGPWDAELAKVPLAGFIVQPEISKLGLSTYPRAEAQAFPILVKDCWKLVGSDVIPQAADVNLHIMLTKQLGWKTWFLPGVTFWHHEATPEELAKHRQLQS